MSFDATAPANTPSVVLDWRQIFQAIPDGVIVIGLNLCEVLFQKRGFGFDNKCWMRR